MTQPIKQYEGLRYHQDYEICTTYPYEVRNIHTIQVIDETFNENNGYYYIKLYEKLYPKHLIIAHQWLHNDDPVYKDRIEHINGNKADNHIENLRWVERKDEEDIPRRRRETVKELPDFTIKVDHYDGLQGIEDLYFCDDVFYVFNGIDYNVLKKRQDHNGFWFVIAIIPEEDEELFISYVRFKHEYDLID